MWTRETRDRMAGIARKTKRYPSDLTDEEWQLIEPLLPRPPRRGRKPSVDLGEVLNAIRDRARSAGGLTDAAGPFRTVADGLLVVPPLRPTPAVQHDPRRRRAVEGTRMGPAFKI